MPSILHSSCAHMERQQKLRRLNDFRRHKGHCSAAVVSQILNDVKENGLPELTTRVCLRQARDSITATQTIHGPLLQHMTCLDLDGGPVQIPITHPLACLTHALEASTSFRKFFRQRLADRPATPENPWTIVIYSDEVTPGNVLALANDRKFQAVYWTFLELGTNALSREESWFTVLTEYIAKINELDSGLSQALGAIFKLFHQPPFDIRRTGITLRLGDGDDDDDATRFFAKIDVVLQDGGAHKYTWMCRGDGASRFCMLCKNLFSADSRILAEDGSALLRCNIIKLDELIPSTDAELRGRYRHMVRIAPTFTSETAFAELQQAFGLTYGKLSIMADPSLDSLISPTNAYTHDWMHGIFVDGVMNLCIFLVFEVFIDKVYKGIYE